MIIRSVMMATARVLGVLLLTAGVAYAQIDTSDRSTLPPKTITGLTSPERRAVLASTIPGRISRIAAAEGSFVESGEPVVLLEDASQRWRAEMARAVADSTLEIDLAHTRWERARLELERLTALRGGESASSKELQDATLNAEMERVSLETARFNREQARRAFQREDALLAEHRITAPFSGYVAEHLKHDGETVDELAGIVVLAQLNPLQVVLDCPLEYAGSFKRGDRLMVQPVGWANEQSAPRHGVVTLVNRIADGASQTFRVKLRVENTDADWVSGMKVSVALPVEARDRESTENPGLLTSPAEPGSGAAKTISFRRTP